MLHVQFQHCLHTITNIVLFQPLTLANLENAELVPIGSDWSVTRRFNARFTCVVQAKQATV